MKLEFFYSLKQCQPSSCILSKCLCQIKSAHRGDEGGVINKDMVFQEQDFFIQSIVLMLLKACHEILVLEVIGDSCCRKGLVLFGKGLVVFITSSNCRWKSLSKEYKQFAHNKIWGEIFNCFAII